MPSPSKKQNDAVELLKQKLTPREVINFSGIEIVSPRARLAHSLKQVNLEELAADNPDDVLGALRTIFPAEVIEGLVEADPEFDELSVLTMWAFGNVQNSGGKPLLWGEAVEAYAKVLAGEADEGPKAKPTPRKSASGGRSRKTSTS